ncbi:sensor histidine kinase [Arthrobacter sp. STN4]|uniref:sensor histidine kinase n=1 Tax=Arthrobacter sp. STN4 TaxID=2923276 RepID=UPI00211A91DA|nr:sensor histidine kinase [Arthrobacter sp. STN4]MCQ9163759.1 sensor histidine kinase [Arthrobacter sp. STN4]
MRTHDQAGAAERTSAVPADVPAAALLADEFSASRRGVVRKYFHNHPRVMDVVVVLAYLVASAGALISPRMTGHGPVQLVLVAASCIVLMFRRDKPLAVLAVLLVFEVINIAMVPAASNVGASVWFALYVVALVYRGIFSFTVAAVASIPLMAYTLLFYQFPTEFLTANGPTAGESNVITAIATLLSNVIATGVGASVRRSREHEAELRQWAVRNAQLASIGERNRIAREMHDVVAHSLTVMVALSDGAAVVVKRNPEQAADVLGQLSGTGRTALADMRRVLGVLRDDSGTEPRSPQPALTDLAALFEGFRQAGLPLSVTQSGPSLPPDPALQLTVYRIVQESLTNVLRYGTSVSRVQVLIENNPDAGQLKVAVADDGRGSLDASMGTGHGLVGMRERARIYAGTVTAGPAPAGGWAVDAVLHPAAAQD